MRVKGLILGAKTLQTIDRAVPARKPGDKRAEKYSVPRISSHSSLVEQFNCRGGKGDVFAC